MKNWTREHLQSLKDKGLIEGFTELAAVKKSKRAKYGNSKVEWNGEVFDSKKEYLRHMELLLMLKAGVIGQLRRQVAYELNEGGSHSLKYVADEVYIMADTGEEVVEDSKGYRTKEYLKKKRLMLKVHGIVIKET